MNVQTRNTVLEQMQEQLHDLCQPLTALQCRLEIGKIQGRESALLEAVEDALEETRRMFAAIDQMRQQLQRKDSR